MSLKERVYSVLVVSAVSGLNTALPALLPESHYYPVKLVTNVSAGRRAWNERSYDYVIINSPLPDDTGVRFAIDLTASGSAAVLLLVRAEISDDIRDKVVEHGIFTLSKPFAKSIFLLALDWMASARERLRKTEKRTLSIEEKMEEIRIVNRAKWLLISELKMEEPQAHRYIEKQAMDQCISKKEAAQNILKIYS